MYATCLPLKPNVESFNADALLRRLFAAPVAPRHIPVSVVEDETSYRLTAQLPDGITKDHVNVSLDHGVLTFQVKREIAPATEGKTLLEERQTVDVTRRFDFGEQVAPDGHTAKVEQGQLELVLKKAEKREPQAIIVT